MPRVNVNNRGFSLLELIIVSAILSTLGLLTSKLMIDSIALSSATEARFALSQTSNLVALNLSQSSRCKQALGGVKFALGSADELNKGVQLDYIAIEPANSATTLVRSKDSKLTNGAVVDSIALKPMPPIDSSLATLPSQFTAKLDLTSSAVTLSKQAVSMGPILSLKLDGDGKIESCSNTSDSSENQNANSRVFHIPGDYSFTVPKDVTKLTLEVIGAGGGARAAPLREITSMLIAVLKRVEMEEMGASLVQLSA